MAKTIRNSPAPRAFLEDEDERLTKYEMRNGCLARHFPNGKLDLHPDE